MRKGLIIAGFLLFSSFIPSALGHQTKPGSHSDCGACSVRYFDLNRVALLDSPFKEAQELNRKYLLELQPDRLLAPFLREAGLPPKADSYTNWENTGLDGHIGGHYLSALSLMYASTNDKEIKSRLDYMVDELKRCQDAHGDGYIGGVPEGKTIWKEVAAGNIRAANFNLNGKWVPLYNIHKTYAGLRDAWLYAKNENARDMLVKMTDWAIQLVARLSEEQIQDMLRSEHGGLNETFADVAAITGDEKYLKLARQFSHKLILNPLLAGEDKLTGLHANTQIPKVLGFKRIADMEKDPDWKEAARFFWQKVVEDRSVSIGGNSVSEHFNPAADFSGMIRHIEGPETCNTHNMLRLTKMLYATSADKKYIEYYERAVYNHILSTQHPETGGLVYFTQMRPGHYRVYSQPHTSMWCCVGSGIENHAKYGEMIYAHAGNDLYVNLFIPSLLDWKEKGIRLVQENRFPDEAQTTITVHPEKKLEFTLYIRYPDWVVDKGMTLTVNGKKVVAERRDNGYAGIKRKWKKGDKVVVDMPMSLYAQPLPDHSHYYSFFFGPVALAAKTGTEDMKGLFADDSRGGHIAAGKQIPLKDMPILVCEPEELLANITPVPGKPLTFTISNLYPLETWGELELTPFFRLHDSRYILYWPQANEKTVREMQREIEEQEKQKLRLDAITVDKVVCGEQQPETDHFIQFEHSSTGYTEGVHWREARAAGRFSYQLRNQNLTGKYLYIAYFDHDKNRKTDIFVNDVKLESLQPEGMKSDTPCERIYPMPESEYEKQTFIVRFEPVAGATTARITEVRLLHSLK